MNQIRIWLDSNNLLESDLSEDDESNLRSWLSKSEGPWNFDMPRWRRNLRKKIKDCRKGNLETSVRWVHHITLRDYDEGDPIISKFGIIYSLAQGSVIYILLFFFCLRCKDLDEE